tara:strand:+ start:241 stop:471 length:231 start_codon:yes stop_codon:yes gene_type:complete
MDKFFNSYKFVGLILAVLIFVSLTGCGTKTITVHEENKMPTTLETIGKMEGIVFALGCMFAPDQCSEIVNKKDKND